MTTTATKKPVRITAEWLKRKNACDDHQTIFQKEWPDGVDLTAENVRRAKAIGLDMEWFAEKFLTHSMFRAYFAQCKPLRDAYEAQRKPLDDAYEAQRKPLDDAYEAQRKPLRDAYEAQCKPLDDAYFAQRTALLIGILGLE